MSVLITAVIVGLGFAYFATQNTVGVPINLGPYQLTQIPIYILALGSLLIGLILSWIISLFTSLESFLSLQGKENKIRENAIRIRDLQQKVQELELENTHLRARGEDIIEQPITASPVKKEAGPQDNVFARVRRRLIHHPHPTYTP